MTGSDRPPRIALAIQRLVPAGGLEQHALRLAEALATRGAEVALVTTQTPATAPAFAALRPVAARGRTNHGRLEAFAVDASREAAAWRSDLAVAFHAIPGFDALFLADPSRARPRGLRGWLPRYRAFARLERAALGPEGARLALTLSSVQRDAFARNHPASPARIELLPPTVDRRRAGSAARPAGSASAARRALGMAEAGPVWLWIGLQPRTKGLDRTLAALAQSPEARLLVAGLSPEGKAGADARRLAARLGVEARVAWLGFTGEAALADAFAAADMLVHPSRADVTGTVILEAMASGLPVITTAACGYAEHVRAADAGAVLPEPFEAKALARAIEGATPAALARWSANAGAYVGQEALFSGLERAADLLLSVRAR